MFKKADARYLRQDDNFSFYIYHMKEFDNDTTFNKSIISTNVELRYDILSVLKRTLRNNEIS